MDRYTLLWQRIKQSNTPTLRDAALYSVRLEVRSVQESSATSDSSLGIRKRVQLKKPQLKRRHSYSSKEWSES
jgi:hypothetical protein